ncbi:type 1 glutamine amidotransferase family protein [Exiguobacterium acetylicum]|uniref:type 1 glutamine amidotransferase family protein n=1 Tax=Exiguobacterium acetylicum TaxID=41170 RepID=UPI0011EF3C77|nr:type 1 glutamine amidotransferase family protein [Exiguobacterium acetylicum]
MLTQIVYLYVFDSISDWEYGYVMPELHSRRYLKTDAPQLNVVTVGPTLHPITTMGGLRILPDIAVSQLELTLKDALILPGGQTWQETLHDPLLSKVGDALSNGTLIAAICGATEGLAKSGFLDQRFHTSNDLSYLQSVCSNYSGTSFYQYTPVVRDDSLITASGMAALEFAHEMIRALDVFTPETLEAWYGLHKTNEAKYFFDLMAATSINQ